MTYENIIKAIGSEPWAILPAKMVEIMAVVEAKVLGVDITAEQVQAAMDSRRTPVSAQSSVAVIPVMGTIYQRANLMQQTSGGATSTGLSSSIKAAATDSSVAAILLHVDSPGGQASGVQELSDVIRSAGKVKPVVAIAEGMAASAAYWIASSATEFYATPSTDIGSIGTLMMHTDVSGAEENAGVKTTIIKAGRNKAFGNPYSPLSDEDASVLQAMVDEANESFVSAVAKNRNVSKSHVNAEFGQGLLFSAKEAKARGMIDDVRTLDQAVDRVVQIARRQSTRRRAAAAVAVADAAMRR